ncbi:MAG: cell division protein FtsL [Actinomycetota bacterium]
MAAGAMHITGMITPVDTRTPVRRCVAGITPEFYFHKSIDNSRLVRVSDPRRRREIRVFSGTMAALFLLVLFYAWQHFSAVQYGYKIEAQKTQREQLVEQNRTLKLEQAGLRDPERIDTLARKMGLQSPQPGQVVQLENQDSSTPVMASIRTVEVVSAQ